MVEIEVLELFRAVLVDPEWHDRFIGFAVGRSSRFAALRAFQGAASAWASRRGLRFCRSKALIHRRMNADPLSTLADTEGLPPTADIDEADKVPVPLDEAGEEILPEEDGEEGDRASPPWEAERRRSRRRKRMTSRRRRSRHARCRHGPIPQEEFQRRHLGQGFGGVEGADEEARVEYTEAAAVEKARYEEQKASYKPLFDAWAEAHPVAAANIAFQTKASADLALDKKIAYLPWQRCASRLSSR